MLKVNINRLGNTAVLSAQGRIVRGETNALCRAVLAERHASAVVLDLAQVNIIDAGGLGVLLELREFTESRGIEFRLQNVSKLVRQVLEITRLDTVFRLTIAGDQCVGSLQRRPMPLAACA
ncbi:MAG TPA: STAS domain-containing protein [Pyrinomonadaceae bacterium]|nr:STAS domain-containing protein [Pyrinomonadaceae bacterium]